MSSKLCAWVLLLIMAGLSAASAVAQQVSVSKTHAPQTFVAGGTGSFSVTVSYSGGEFYQATLTVTDTLDPAFTAGTPSGTGWTCTVNGQTVSCSTSVYYYQTGPAASITIPVTIAASASGTISNTVNASGIFDGQVTINATPYTDTVPISSASPPPPPQISVTETHTPATAFAAGGNGTLVIQANNSGMSSIVGTFTMTAALDPALTVSGVPTGTGWTCQVQGQTVTCATPANTPVPAQSTMNPVTVLVKVAGTAKSTISNTVNAQAQIPSEGGTQTVSATPYVDTIAVNASALTLTTNPPASLPAGGKGTFGITVTNSGTAPTNANINLAYTLATVFTPGTPVVTGSWTCQTSGQTVNCSDTDVLAINGSATVSIPVSVSATASGTVTNTAVASGGGTGASASVTDTVQITLPIAISVVETHTPAGGLTAGGTGSLSIQASNSGAGAITGTFTVTAALDPTLTVSGVPAGTGWTCQAQGQVVTCATAANTQVTANTALNPITVAFKVAGTANGAISNTINAQVQTATQTVAATPYVDKLTVNGPVLTLTTTPPATLQAGGKGSFGITITNSGTAADKRQFEFDLHARFGIYTRNSGGYGILDLSNDGTNGHLLGYGHSCCECDNDDKHTRVSVLERQWNRN